MLAEEQENLKGNAPAGDGTSGASPR
jgi:hypothetical protein